jgi:UDP-glucose:tetrahydrobiopterin glucosyltransferase
LIKATKSISEIKRKNCRAWFEKKATSKVFAERVENWLYKGLNKKISADFQD